MGVYIKGMELPTKCVDCRFCDEIDATCIALNDNSTACITGKPDWCPLIEVPTPHGDLIDRDKLNVHNYWYDKPKNGKTHFAFVYNGDIKKVEVIIGAEDGT